MKDRYVRLVAIAGLAIGICCVAVLHVVRSDLPPAAHRLSEYAVGRYGWLMTGAFLASSCGLLALGVTLWRNKGRERLAWIVPGSAFLAGVAMLVSGIFRTDVTAMSELIHSRASSIAVISIVILAVAYCLPFVRPSGASRDRVSIYVAAIAVVCAALSSLLHQTRWTGLGQRLLWIVLIGALVWVATTNSATRRSTMP